MLKQNSSLRSLVAITAMGALATDQMRRDIGPGHGITIDERTVLKTMTRTATCAPLSARAQLQNDIGKHNAMVEQRKAEKKANKAGRKPRKNER